MNFDVEIYEGKTLSSLFKDIYNNVEYRKKQVDFLIKSLEKFVIDPVSAGVIVPLIREYLEVGVKSEEHLVRLAGVIQRVASKDITAKDGSSDLLSDAERKQLLGDVKNLFEEHRKTESVLKETKLDSIIKESEK